MKLKIKCITFSRTTLLAR